MDKILSKSRLLKLAIKCPRVEREKNCPLYAKKDMSSEELVEWLLPKDKDEIQGMFAAHCECLKEIS